MKNIAIYGFGGLGREVACLINSVNDVNPEWKKTVTDTSY